MKIAYLILCHTDYDHIKRLISALTCGEDTSFFIHIDKKSSIEVEEVTSISKNVHAIKTVNANWGGYSLCEALIELIKSSLQTGEMFDRYIYVRTGLSIVV